MVVVSGENIILYKLDTSSIPATEIPFACSTNCSFSTATDMAMLSSANNAYFNVPTIDLSSWNVTCDGLTSLSGYAIDDIANEQKNRTIFTIRFSIDNGVDGYKYISGYCFISNYSISGSINSVSPIQYPLLVLVFIIQILHQQQLAPQLLQQPLQLQHHHTIII